MPTLALLPGLTSRKWVRALQFVFRQPGLEGIALVGGKPRPERVSDLKHGSVSANSDLVSVLSPLDQGRSVDHRLHVNSSKESEEGLGRAANASLSDTDARDTHAPSFGDCSSDGPLTVKEPGSPCTLQFRSHSWILVSISTAYNASNGWVHATNYRRWRAGARALEQREEVRT